MQLSETQIIISHSLTITMAIINSLLCLLYLFVVIKRKQITFKIIISSELSIYILLHSFTFFFVFSSQNKFCEFLGSLHTTSMMTAITCTDIIVLFAFLVFQDPIKNNPEKSLFKYGFSLICPIISIILIIINYCLGKVNRQNFGQCRLDNMTLVIINAIYCGIIVTFSITFVVILMIKGCNAKETENDNNDIFREFWFYIIGQAMVYLTYISYIIKATSLLTFICI